MTNADEVENATAMAKYEKQQRARDLLYPLLVDAYYQARKKYPMLRVTKKTHRSHGEGHF